MSSSIEPIFRAHYHSPRGLLPVAACYVAGLVTANAIAAKLVEVGGMPFTVGAIAYPVTFVLQDVINERYGARVARAVVWSAFLGAGLLVLFTSVALAIQESPVRDLNGCFEAVFAPTPRIVLGSVVAFVTGGMVDVSIFFRIRKFTGVPHLWARKIGSTLVSQGVDTVVFVSVAFGGLIPFRAALAMMLGQYLLKQAIAVAALPVSYSVLRVLR